MLRLKATTSGQAARLGIVSQAILTKLSSRQL